MFDEIKDVIEKNLPAQVGATLKEVLDKAKKDSESVNSLTKKNELLEKTIKEKDDLINNYKQFDNRNILLSDKEKSLIEREINLKIKELEYQLNCEKEKTEFTKNVALSLVKNTEYRRTIFDSVTDSSNRDQYGNPVYVNKSQSLTENITTV